MDFSSIPISAIFVFHDPRNWSLDIQVMLDVIRSRGIIGGPYLDAHAEASQTEQPSQIRMGRDSSSSSSNPVELVFCNPDLLWKSDFPQPRIGQGAFREAFQAVYKVRRASCVDDRKPRHGSCDARLETRDRFRVLIYYYLRPNLLHDGDGDGDTAALVTLREY